MRITPHIPDLVRESIRRHIRRAVKAAVDAHESGHENEDTLTGHLGFALRTGRQRRVQVNGQTWSWAIYYHKFRGLGPKATEHLIGADGLVVFSIDAVEQHGTKTALFQAKLDTGGLQGLLAQCIALTTWKEAAFIIKYGPARYTALDLENGLKQALRLPHPDEAPLEDFLLNVFIACLLGDSELCYEPSHRILQWRDQNGEIVHTSFAVRHRLEIRVNGRQQGPFHRGTRIEPSEIPEHRMKVTHEEMLGVGRTTTLMDVKRARREAAKIYHVDKHQQLEPGVRDILNLRMKEHNAAADRVLVRLRRETNE